MSELTCREVIECLADYFAEALGPEEREAFERHLGACDNCMIYLRQYRDTINLVVIVR